MPMSRSWKTMKARTAVFLIFVTCVIPLYYIGVQNHDEILPNAKSKAPYLKNTSCGILTVDTIPNAGLGNHLFQWAAIYGLARKLGRRPVINEEAAPSILPMILRSNDVELAKSIKYNVSLKENGMAVSSDSFSNIPCNNQVVRLCCFLQSWRYFIDYEAEIREQLTFIETVETGCKRALAYERRKTGVGEENLWLVGVHIRNYTVEGVISDFGFSLPNMTYIQQAMAHFRKLAKSAGKVARFVIVARERDRIREVFGNKHGSDVHIAEEMGWELDFCLLTKTDHLITTTGSFAWWAMFLNKGKVLRQPDYCTVGTPHCGWFGKDAWDYFLKDRWTTL